MKKHPRPDKTAWLHKARALMRDHGLTFAEAARELSRRARDKRSRRAYLGRGCTPDQRRNATLHTRGQAFIDKQAKQTMPPAVVKKQYTQSTLL